MEKPNEKALTSSFISFRPWLLPIAMPYRPELA
jgi:hypothetical protein